MSVQLRAATEGDREFARRTHHDAFHDVVVRQFGSFDEAQQDGFFDAEWDASTFEIVQLDGEDVGYVLCTDDPGAFKVQMIVIAPRFQNRGIGTQLMVEILERARNANKPVWLGALYENGAAQRLYDRLGFRKIGGDDTHILMEWRPSGGE